MLLMQPRETTLYQFASQMSITQESASLTEVWLYYSGGDAEETDLWRHHNQVSTGFTYL